jgi:hypothetical protein
VENRTLHTFDYYITNPAQHRLFTSSQLDKVPNVHKLSIGIITHRPNFEPAPGSEAYPQSYGIAAEAHLFGKDGNLIELPVEDGRNLGVVTYVSFAWPRWGGVAVHDYVDPSPEIDWYVHR